MTLVFHGKEIQMADAFTKILGKELFGRFRRMLMLVPYSEIEGVCCRLEKKKEKEKDGRKKRNGPSVMELK